MNTQGSKLLSLIGAFGTAAAVSVYVAWSLSRGYMPNDHLFTLHQAVISFLLATWLVADTKESHCTPPSFDFGWFIVLAFPVYSGYYLISTRRWLKGILMLVGMILLVFLPRLAALIPWHVS
jgi:hypothetical protein